MILNEIFIRNPQFLHVNTSTSESRCMKTLKEVHQRFKEGKFHESKMQLWTSFGNRKALQLVGCTMVLESNVL